MLLVAIDRVLVLRLEVGGSIAVAEEEAFSLSLTGRKEIGEWGSRFRYLGEGEDSLIGRKEIGKWAPV